MVEAFFENVFKGLGVAYEKYPVEAVRAGNVLHLKTSFSFSFAGNVHAILHAMHPSPAVCGLPKAAAAALGKPHTAGLGCIACSIACTFPANEKENDVFKCNTLPARTASTGYFS